MLVASIPAKFPIPWGNSAGGSYIRTIPVASQIGIHNGYASLTDGFPPLNMTALTGGGVPPFGQDMNGILNEITKWNQWQQAGGPIAYDGTFSASVGGYPQGAIVASATTGATFWYSTTDNNVTNPDTGGAGWIGFTLYGALYAVDSGTVNTLVVAFPTGIVDVTGRLLSIRVSNTNTAGVTLNLGGGTKNVLSANGNALTPGALLAGQIINVIYTGAYYQLQNPWAFNILGVGMLPVNPIDVTATQNAQSVVSIFNDSTGAAAGSMFQAINHNAHVCQMLMFGSGYTSSGIFQQDGGLVYANGAGGLTLATGANQPIYGAINNNAAFRFQAGPAGGFGFGMNVGSTPRGITDFFGNSNANVDFYFQNGNSGVAANTVVRIINSAGTGAQLYHTSNSYTPSGLTGPDQTSILTTGAGGMLVGTATSSNLVFGTNNVQAGYFDTSQNLNLTHPLFIANGGTNANTAAGARTNLNINVLWSSVTGLGAGSQVITYSHGLGGNPSLIEVFVTLICNSADAGYGVGDVIRWGSTMPDNANRLTTVNTNPGGTATFVVIGTGINVANFSTQANTTLTLTKWNIQIGVCLRNS